ncbi:MAG: cation diffusion facilitator family transporter [Clostridia bacterium]|nr:cation diffusion facilitator family transporter [Clostridia bacterium]MDE7215444.1 cation diffusion facilitator family transporter [Clostridia bacterium]
MKIQDKQNAVKTINKVATVTIVVNLLLAVGKFVAGFVGNSTAMISDAVHSASDVASTVIVLIGARIAVKNEDKDHNYGHDKFESIASIILAMMLFATALMLGYAGIKSVINATKGEFVKPSYVALVAAIVSVVVKEGMYWYTIFYAKKLDSQALKADAWHHRSDAFSSIAGFVGILGAILGALVLEGIATVLIALLIIKVSYDIVKVVLRQLTDHAASDELYGKIYKTINEDKDVKNIDLLKTRISGSIIYVEAEIAVDSTLNIVDAHEIAQRVHDNIESTFEEVRHIVIHVNPFFENEDTQNDGE